MSNCKIVPPLCHTQVITSRLQPQLSGNQKAINKPLITRTALCTLVARGQGWRMCSISRARVPSHEQLTQRIQMHRAVCMTVR